MLESVNGLATQDIRTIHPKGVDSSSCATGIPAFVNMIERCANDPVTSFKQQPHLTINAKELVYHEAHKNLPADLLQAQLSPEANKIRTLIGVIYQGVKDRGDAADIAKLDKVCEKLAKANGIEKKEQKVEKDLSGLVSKYSAGGFEKIINQYIAHCMEAWEEHHQARSVDVKEKTIFKQCLDVCKATIKHDLDGLTQPDQPWETMAQKLNFFVNDCAAISKTLTFYDADPVTPAPKGPEPMMPASKGPEPQNLKPQDAAGNQQLYIPTGPGQGGISLNITNSGGSVGDITHSAGATTAAPVDSNSAIVKHILDSGLTNVEKVGLIKDLFNANIGGAGYFLNNLAGVQGFQQEQPVGTQQVNVAKREIETQTTQPGLHSIATQTEGGSETDNVSGGRSGSEPAAQQQPTIQFEQNKLQTAFDGGSSQTQHMQDLEGEHLDVRGLGEKSEQPVLSSLTNTDSIYTTTRMFDPLNRRNSAPTHFLPTGFEPESGQASEKRVAVTLEDAFKALKQRDSSVFDHLDKTQSASMQEETLQPFTEFDVEKPVANSVMASELESDVELDSAPKKLGSMPELTTTIQQRQASDNASRAQGSTESGAAENLTATGALNTKNKENATVASKASGRKSDDTLNSASKNFDFNELASAVQQRRQALDNASPAQKTAESGVPENLTATGMPDTKTMENATVLSTDSGRQSDAELDSAPKNFDLKELTSVLQQRQANADASRAQNLTESGAAGKATASSKMTNPGTDTVDSGTLRKNNEQINQKSAAANFQPARITSEAVTTPVNKSANGRVYTTVRTVDAWKREPTPANFLPPISESDSTKLDEVFSGLKPRDLSAFDAFDNKKIEQPQEKGQLTFQEKLAEFKRKGQLKATSHE